MLNQKTGNRELAYIVKVLETKDLEGYDNVHYVRVNSWWCVAHIIVSSLNRVYNISIKYNKYKMS